MEWTLELIAATIETTKASYEVSGKIKAWLTGKLDSYIATQLDKAIATLPKNATPQEAADAIMPIYDEANGIGGSVNINAGANGGGNVRLDNANATGGNGKAKGGDLNLRAGDGGPDGKGGDIFITGGTYTGGSST